MLDEYNRYKSKRENQKQAIERKRMIMLIRVEINNKSSSNIFISVNKL